MPDNIEEEYKYSRLWLILLCAFMVVLPFFISMILYFTKAVDDSRSYFAFLEIFTTIFGLLTLVFMVMRIFFRDRVNYRKTKSVHEDHNTKDYKRFIINQWVLVGVGVFLLLFSLLAFLIK